MTDNINFYQYRTPRFLKDIERCPYLPKDSGYEEWNRKDKERLEELEKNYQEIKNTATQLLSAKGKKLVNLAKFVLDMIRD